MKKTKADPTLMMKEEFFAQLDRAEEQYRRGEGIRLSSHEELHAWLNSL